MIFAAFNGAALVHMFLTAPETKGKTLEEMDDVFDVSFLPHLIRGRTNAVQSGRPVWKSGPTASRLDTLQKDIEEGNLKVNVGAAAREAPAAAPVEPVKEE